MMTFEAGDAYVSDELEWFEIGVVRGNQVRIGWYGNVILDGQEFSIAELSEMCRDMVKTTPESARLMLEIDRRLHRADLETAVKE